MKNSIYTVLLIALAAVLFVSCESTDKGKGKLDPNAMISLRPAAGVQLQSASKVDANGHFTAKEIVEQASSIWFWNKAITTQNALGRGFAAVQRDFVNLRLLMWGTDIITMEGQYAPDFIEGEDVILTKEIEMRTMDTIGYIPNSVLRKAQPLIKAAYDAGDYTTVYDLFDKAFTFTPITGAEWLELKRQNKQ